MTRHWAILFAAAIAATAYDNRGKVWVSEGANDDQNVILVVSDGLRWQEVFTGADSAILFGEPAMPGGNAEATRRKFWRATAAERRAVLMPFVWGTIAREGQLFGNRELSSRVEVTNDMKFSYPGYNEMLVGAPDPRIDRNDFGPNPNVTVFEWLNGHDGFRGRVAAFGTWDVFRDIFNVGRSRLQVHTFGAKPHDEVVQAAVLRYMKKARPRAMFVGYAETDDWGHEGRYDRFLDAAHAVDAHMAQLWAAAQAHPQYRGKTTLIFTADHGRGRGASDWKHHNSDVPGSEETFIIAIGPHLERTGEHRNTADVLGWVAELTANAVGLAYRAGSVTTGAGAMVR
ncbi:MAG TPA: hypothetical protein VF128_10785 [Gemmatimonadaceae bacterium]